jgi:hypothetical protein
LSAIGSLVQSWNEAVLVLPPLAVFALALALALRGGRGAGDAA